ncbi:MAG: type II toxin-antitoxin system PemK/MazF family toxin [Aeromicrobium sp.]
MVWAELDPAIGREPSGRRPAVVVSSDAYNESVASLVIVLPITTTDRGWPHHVQLAGSDLALRRTSFAITEQPRTIDRRRVVGGAGRVDPATLDAIGRWLKDFIG